MKFVLKFIIYCIFGFIVTSFFLCIAMSCIVMLFGVKGKFLGSLGVFCGALMVFYMRFVMKKLRGDYYKLYEQTKIFSEDPYLAQFSMKVYDSFNIIGIILSSSLLIFSIIILIFFK